MGCLPSPEDDAELNGAGDKPRGVGDDEQGARPDQSRGTATSRGSCRPAGGVVDAAVDVGRVIDHISALGATVLPDYV